MKKLKDEKLDTKLLEEDEADWEDLIPELINDHPAFQREKLSQKNEDLLMEFYRDYERDNDIKLMSIRDCQLANTVYMISREKNDPSLIRMADIRDDEELPEIFQRKKPTFNRRP